LVLSQEEGRIVETDRAGNILSTLTITGDPTDTLNVGDMQHEGLTMDDQGFLYVTNENGGGSIASPEMWVYAPVPEPTGLLAVAGIAAGAVLRRRRHV
ncbi:MAG TPA: SdiA-regulated domain-containing protein, partial [Tepidisphaeraceae bacterium]